MSDPKKMNLDEFIQRIDQMIEKREREREALLAGLKNGPIEDRLQMLEQQAYAEMLGSLMQMKINVTNAKKERDELRDERDKMKAEARNAEELKELLWMYKLFQTVPVGKA